MIALTNLTLKHVVAIPEFLDNCCRFVSPELTLLQGSYKVGRREMTINRLAQIGNITKTKPL